MSDADIRWMRDYRLPLKRGCENYFTFIQQEYKKYLKHINRCELLTADDKIKIKALTDAILQSYQQYTNYHFSLALNTISCALNQVREMLLTCRLNQRIPLRSIGVPSFYRIRAGAETYSYLEMLHVPFSKSNFASENRFSIAGVPCSYMASSKEIAWYECHMPDTFQLAEYIPNPNTNVELLCLDINPLQFYQHIATLYNNKDYTETEYINIVKKIYFTFPIIEACSVVVKTKRNSMQPEYIIPQLIMKWIQSDIKYVGVRYRTSVANELIDNCTGFNIAIPARKSLYNDYSEDLCTWFDIDISRRSISYTMVETLYEKYGSAIKNLDKQYEKYKYQYQHSEDNIDMYKAFCDITLTAISLLRSMKRHKSTLSDFVIPLVKLFDWSNMLIEHIYNAKNTAEREQIVDYNVHVHSLLNNIHRHFTSIM